MPIAFADCELDEQLYQLRRSGRVVKMEPKVFDVLLHLIHRRERVVSKIELLDGLWPGEAVSESVLPRCIAAARRAIGDDRTRQGLIQTVHGRGYRFIAEVTSPVPAGTEDPAPPDAAPALSLFVGRDAAMDRLTEALTAIPRSGGRITLLVGEPGIGKTRTAEEGVAAARSRGFPVSIGRCYEGEGAPAYWPWVQVLRSCIEGADREALRVDMGPGAADLACLVPELRGDFPELPPSEPIEGQQARFRLFDSVARFLVRSAARTPRVIVLDDLHWADADSLLLMQFFATPLRAAPILLIGTYRDVEVRRDHPLGALLGALAREPHCERVALRGLGQAEVTTLIEGIAGMAPSPRLAESVYDMTEGNPFFVHEVVRLLAEQDRLVNDDENLALSLPQSVRDAIGRRLDSLSPECNELLRAAAVLGREFTSAVLERVIGKSADALLELLGEALAAQLLVEGDELGHYAFAHALTRHTLRDELHVPQRVALHRRIAEVLEGERGDSGDGLSALAHHFFEAAPGGDVQKAIVYSVRAAERADELFAYDESMRHYERALEALELRLPVDEGQRCQLLLALAEECWAAGMRDRSRADFAKAADIARRRGDVELLARAAVGLRGYGEMGMAPDDATLALLREALEAVGDAHPISRSRVLSRLAGSAPYARSMQTRRDLSGEAYALAIQSGDRVAIADAVAARYWASLGPDRVDDRRVVGQEALALGQEWEDPRLRILGYEALIGADLLCGQLDEAGRAIASYEALAVELRQPIFLFLASLLRGSFALNLGRFEEAESHFLKGVELGQGTVVYSEVLYAGTVFWLHSIRGDVQTFDGIEGMVRGVFSDEDISGRNLLEAGMAFAKLTSGDREGARRGLEAVMRADLRSVERDEHWLMAMGSLSDVICAFDDRESAELVYELLSPYAHLMVMHDLIRAVPSTVSSVLGSLATATRRFDAAEAHFADAIAREEALGLGPALCGSRAGLAGLLLARARPGERARAEALLQAAEDGARAMGSHRSYRPLLPSA